MPKFCVLHCEKAKQWEDMDHHFQRHFEETGDEWKCFHVHKEGATFPSFEDFKGFVITGSHNSAYDSDPWIAKLLQWIRDFHRYSKQHPEANLKLFGSCFGCQLIGEALGGHVERIPDDTHKTVFVDESKMIYRVESVNPTSHFNSFIDKLNRNSGSQSQQYPPSSLALVESHGDQVRDLPPGSVHLASSISCHHEMFILDNDILAIQSHPEWTLSEAERNTIKILDESVAKRTRDAFLNQFPISDHNYIMNVVKSFLRN